MQPTRREILAKAAEILTTSSCGHQNACGGRPPLDGGTQGLQQGCRLPRIRDTGSFGINILGQDQQGVCNDMAQSGQDKFANVSWRSGGTGAPMLADVLAFIECSIEAEHDAGDHTIVVGRVQDYQRVRNEAAPLLYFRSMYGSFA